MDFEDLKSPALREKLKAAKTPEDMLAIAKEEGYELTDEQLDGIAGGWGCWEDGCADNAPCGGYIKGK